ncbi:Chromosomal replication initiator protein DnaA [Candidatus Xenohaliotis californiensis]|uniref:Chromosomal replication initiator protein DnaA n=1 Tax=Candidatus Xenohaliotis californiensis TaxID=84677 RepID=A0ABP0EST9_9RICK|nr:Chromosomal replication initiator protein DnaA [Candidatus Xenohaliotis californiensis]
MSIALQNTDQYQSTISNDEHLLWAQIKKSIISKYLGFTSRWLNNLDFKSTENNKIILVSSSYWTKDYVERHYTNDILIEWQNNNSNINNICIEVNCSKPSNKTSQSKIKTHSNSNYSNNSINTIEIANNFSSPLDPRFTFDSFVVAKPNEFAFNAAYAMAKNNGPMPNSNPLFLRGDVGLGKTHLMHAAGHYIKAYNARKRVVYLSAERYMYHFINSLRNKNIFDFKEYFRSADVLMVDDIQFISGKEGTQEEFFHTFNELINSNKQLVFSADRPPCELKRIEERIRSRLNCGLVVDVNATTFELRLGILQSKIRNIPIHIPDNILEYLASNIMSNVRELEGALNRVVAYAKYNNTNITIDNTRSILSDMLIATRIVVTIKDIQCKTAEYFDITTSAICSASRERRVTIPRQIAMYLSKTLTTKSLPEIGREFGGRDHTTVIHACRKIVKLKQTDVQIDQKLEAIRKHLHQC